MTKQAAVIAGLVATLLGILGIVFTAGQWTSQAEMVHAQTTIELEEQGATLKRAVETTEKVEQWIAVQQALEADRVRGGIQHDPH